jgi:hypothetical protein
MRILKITTPLQVFRLKMDGNTKDLEEYVNEILKRKVSLSYKGWIIPYEVLIKSVIEIYKNENNG